MIVYIIYSDDNVGVIEVVDISTEDTYIQYVDTTGDFTTVQKSKLSKVSVLSNNFKIEIPIYDKENE